MGLLTYVAIAAGAGGTVALAPAVLGLAGFTAAGIAVNSIAAGMMSSAAIANGGAVASGTAVAVLQSAGAAGVGAAANVGLASVGGAVGGLIALLI